MLLSPDRKVLHHTVAYGLSDWYVRKGPVSADKSISEALAGRPIAVFDATGDLRIQYREQAKKEGIGSILSVPMTLREEIIGVIRVYTSERRSFTVDDMYFVGGVANLGAIALKIPGFTRRSRKTMKLSGRRCWNGGLPWVMNGRPADP
jgi:GAF domain-containing protein